MNYRLQCEALETRLKAVENERNFFKIRCGELEAKYLRAGEFYLRMQKLILSDENIRSEWDHFYTMMALACPDIKELEE